MVIGLFPKLNLTYGCFEVEILLPNRVRPIWPYRYRYGQTDIQQTDTDTPFHNLYQTDTDTDIWFEIHIKPIPIPIIGIYLYQADIIPIYRLLNRYLYLY